MKHMKKKWKKWNNKWKKWNNKWEKWKKLKKNEKNEWIISEYHDPMHNTSRMVILCIDLNFNFIRS